MDRFERDPRRGTQQARDDIGVPGSGMGDPASGQGQFGQQRDYTDPSGGSYGQQPSYQTGYAAADTEGLDSGQQRSDDLRQSRAGAGTTWDPSNTSDQYGGSQRTASGQTGGYTDPTDDNTAGYGGGGKPSVTSKVKGTAEKFAGKVSGDPGKQSRGQERKEGNY